MLNKSIRKIINVDSPNLIPLYTFKQEDDGIFLLSLFKDSVPLDLTGQTVKLGIKRPNGTLVNLESIEGDNPFTIDNNNLDIKLKNSMLSVPGLCECDLELVDVNGKMTTASFYITVNKKIISDTNISATNEISILEKIKLEEVNRLFNETTRVETEVIRTNSEMNRESSENTRKSNETTRVDAETIRSNEETKRKNNETIRVKSESAREFNEDKRTTNENNRVATEESRVTEFNDIKADYETYKGVMIAESNVAALQSKINVVNASLAENKQDITQLKVDIGTTANIEELKAINNEATQKITEINEKLNKVGDISKTIENVENAKKDFNGKVQDNLSDRLNSDMSYVADRFNNASLLDYEGKYISAEKSYDGFTSGLKVNGNTLQNLSGNKVSFSSSNKLAFTVTETSEYIKVVKVTDEVITWKYAYININNLSLLKPNTKYTLFLRTNKKNDIGVYIMIGDSSNLLGRNENISTYDGSVLTTVITTIPSFADSVLKGQVLYFAMSSKFLSELNEELIMYKNAVLLEGDYTGKPIPQGFEGIQSVGEESGKVEVLSTGKNLFDGNLEIGGMLSNTGAKLETYTQCRTIDYIPIKSNTNYYLSCDSLFNEKTAKIILFYDENKKFISSVSESGLSPQGAKYIKFRTRKTDSTVMINEELKKVNAMLVEGTVTTTYEPYKSDKISILLDESLRKLPNGVADEVDLDNGKLIRKVGKKVFDGSEDWFVYDRSPDITFNNTLSFRSAVITPSILDNNLDNKNLFCNNFIAKSVYAIDEEGLFAKGNIRVAITKSKLSTPDLAGFKQWLQANPTTVYYELATPLETPLDLQNSLRTYDGITHIYTQESLIEPTVQAKIPSDVNAIISTLKLENEELIIEVEENNILNVESSLEQDLRITKIELGVM